MAKDGFSHYTIMATPQRIQTSASQTHYSDAVAEKFENFVTENEEFLDAEGNWLDSACSEEITWDNTEISPDVIEYVMYWKQQWKDHPLNRTDKSIEHHMEIHYAAEARMDWERFVRIQDLVYKWAQKGKMVSAKPPKSHPSITFWDKKGKEVTCLKPYHTYYEGNSKDWKEDKLMTENFSMTHYDKRTHYKFTIGNYEAALRITRQIWKPRLKRGKHGKFNWRYVISPICFEFLAELQTEITGYTKEFMEDFNSIKYRVNDTPVNPSPDEAAIHLERMEDAKSLVMERRLEEDTGYEFEVRKDAKELIDMGCSTNGVQREYSVPAMEEIEMVLPSPETEAVVTITSEGYNYDEYPEELEPNESEAEVEQHSTDSETEKERAELPLEKHTLKQLMRPHKDELRWYPITPIYTEFSENLSKEEGREWCQGSYFKDIEMVMLKIGRPDLVASMRANTRIVWLRKKVFQAYGAHGAAARRRDHMRHRRRARRTRGTRAEELIRGFYGEESGDFDRVLTGEDSIRDDDETTASGSGFRAVWNNAHLEPQAGCVPMQRYRNRVRRIMTQHVAFMQRHRDKMEVLSHRGRFAYLTTWDMALFERQKNKIKTLEMEDYKIFVRDLPLSHNEEFCIPHSYVEEAEFIIGKLNHCIRDGGVDLEYKTVKMMLNFVARWRDREFRVVDTLCFQAQAGETPLQSSAGPSGGGGTDTAAAPIQDEPISSGKKEVTLTTVDQRVPDVDNIPVFSAGKDPKETRQEDPYIMPDIVQRPMMIDRITWGVNDAKFKELRSWVIPHVYFSAQGATPTVCQNLNAAYILAMFGSARFGLKVKIQINSVKFQQGKLMAYFKPYCDDGYDVGEVPNNFMQFPYVMIDASESNPVEMTIPFTNFRDAMPVYNDPHNEYNYFGQFKIIVWNDLKTGANSSNDTSLIVYMSLVEFDPRQLCNPKDPGKVVFASTIRTIPEGTGVQSEKNNPVQYKLHESLRLSTVSAIIQPQMMESLISGGVGLAMEKGPAILESILQNVSRGPNSKPGNPAPAAPVTPQVMTNGAWGEGPDLCNRLSLSPLEITEPPKGSPKKENLHDLCAQWTRIKVMTWSTEDEESKQLHFWPVTPVIQCSAAGMYDRYNILNYSLTGLDTDKKCALKPNYFHGGETVRSPSMLEYIAKAFYYWHGSIKFRLEVVCTNMHSGRLLIRYEPYGTTDSAKLECQKIATPGLIWDVQEQHTLDFEAPYMSCQPFLLTQYYADYAPLKGLYSMINGLCEILVVNRLKVTTGVSSLVEINLYMAAGKDFEFAVPSPLHGITKLREYDVFDSPKPDAMHKWSTFVDLLYAYLQWPFSKSTGEEPFKKIISTAAKTKYWGPFPLTGGVRPLMYGPVMVQQRTSKGNVSEISASQYYDDVLSALKYAKSAVDTEEILFPYCKTLREALAYVGKIPDGVYPTDFKAYCKDQGIEINRSMVQRLRFWLAIATMRHHAWNIKMYPADVDKSYSVVLPASTIPPHPSKCLVPQGKCAPQDEYINPFKGYAPKVKAAKEIMGESFMDMYKILKRYQMWANVSIPDNYNSDDPLDSLNVESAEFVQNLQGLTSWERRNYMLEFRIPVTPFQYFDSFGSVGHCFVRDKSAGNSRKMGRSNLAFEVGGGELGNVCSLTYMRYFAELFTFWKGSMRYRFTLSEPWVNGRPQVMYACYHPRTFHSWDEMLGVPRIVHMKRVRDMSKMGMQMISGNVMGSLDIEVPYYSQYEKLALSASCDETSSTGSVLLYVPIDILTEPTCDFDKGIKIRGCPIQIWTAVGDDFEFIFKRAAPSLRLYPLYVTDEISSYPYDTGYDKANPYKGDNEAGEHNAIQSANYGSTMKELNDDNAWGMQSSHPFPSSQVYWNPVRFAEDTTTAEMFSVIHEIEKFNTFEHSEPEEKSLRKYKLQPQGETKDAESGMDMTGDELDGILSAAGQTIIKMPSILSAVESTLVNFNSAATSVNSAVDKLTGVVEEVRTVVVSSMGKQVEAAEEVKSTAGIMGKVAEWTLTGTRIVIFYQGILSLMEAESWMDRWAPIAQCALAIGLSPEIVMKAGEWMVSSISSLFGTTKGNDVLRTEGYETMWDGSWTAFFEENADLFKFVAAGVFTIVTFYLTSDCPVANNVSTFAANMLRKLKNFAIVGSALKTLDWMWKWVADIIKSALTWIGDQCSGGSITAMRMSAHYPTVVAWLKAVEYYKLDTANMDLCWNADERLKLWKLMDEGEDLLNKLATKFGHLHSTLMRGMTILQNAHNKAVVSRNLAPIREDPFHICLVGSPGVGKSAILTFIMNFIANEAGLPKKNRMYPRAEEDDYWTNYTGQPVVVIDDLYADKRAKAIKEIVKMKSNLAWPLNMADLNEKGRGFMSKLIGSTTNHPYPEHADITCPAAVWRRRDILLNVRRVTPQEHGKGRVHWNDLRFDILDSNNTTGPKLSENMSLEDVLVVGTKAFLRHSMTQKALVMAGLQGKAIQVVDYGDDDVQEAQTVVSISASILDMIRRKVNIGEDVFAAWLQTVSVNDFMAMWNQPECQEVMKKSKQINEYRAMKFREIKAREFYSIVQQEKKELYEAMWIEASSMGLYRVDASGDGKMLYYIPMEKIGETERREWGTLMCEVDKAGKEFQIYITNGGANELEVEFDDSLTEKARESIQKFESIQNDCETLVQRILMRPKKKTLQFSDDQELKGVISQCFPEMNTEQKAKMMTDMKEIYASVEKQTATAREMKYMEDVDFGELFTKDCKDYWKEVNGHWEMVFTNETLTEKEFGWFSKYELMKIKWTQKEIDDAKNDLPTTDLPLEGFVKRTKQYLDLKKTEAQKWIEEHPNVMKAVKLLGMAAGLFASYKILKYLCPGIIDRMHDFMAGLFGWTKKAIGEDRVDAVIATGKRLGSNARSALQARYAAVRAWMLNSGDPALVESATDDETVVMFAEMMEKSLQNGRTGLVLKGKIAEQRSRPLSPYVVSDGNFKVKTEHVAKPLKSMEKELETHGSEDPNAEALRRHKIVPNMVYVSRIRDETNSVLSMTGLFIDKSDLLLPWHFVVGCKDGTKLSITTTTGAQFFDVFMNERCIKVPDQDAVIFRCGPRVGLYKSLIHQFLTESDLERYNTLSATLNVLTPEGVIVVQQVTTILEREITYHEGKIPIKNAVMWGYEAVTQVGDCGAVLVAHNSAVQRKILGIHVAGAQKAHYGGSTVITQEILQSIVDTLPVVTFQKPSDGVPAAIITKPISEMKVKPQGNFTLMGAVAMCKEVKLPHKTEIEPSAIHDMVRKHVTEPAVLTRNDPRYEGEKSPLMIALEKYGKPTLPFDPVDLDYIAADLTAEVKTWSRPMGTRKLSDWEAVFGNETIDYCDRMNLSASPGYPYTLSRPSGEKGKAYLYDAAAANGIRDEYYLQEYTRREELAKQGIRKDSIWTDCLKDERRPLEKIKAGKTRAFVLPPADYVQLSRKYLMAFCVSFYTNHIKSFSAVGLDPYSFDWTRLVRKLKRKSAHGFGGDFHSFDGIFDPDIMWRIGKIIDAWYKHNRDEDWEESDTVVREVLFQELCHTVHICLNSIYKTHQGNPSGNPLTVVVNTFAHCFYIRLAWLALSRRCGESASLHLMHRLIAEIYYGDDGLAAVPLEVEEWFNLRTVSEFLWEYGIEYTSESKDENLYGVRKLTHCTFLKNGMKKMQGRNLWLAPIAEDTIYELTNWVRKSDDPIAQMRENLENALKFAFHHGRAFYDSLLMRINEALAKKGLMEMSTTFEIQERNFLLRCVN